MKRVVLLRQELAKVPKVQWPAIAPALSTNVAANERVIVVGFSPFKDVGWRAQREFTSERSHLNLGVR